MAAMGAATAALPEEGGETSSSTGNGDGGGVHEAMEKKILWAKQLEVWKRLNDTKLQRKPEIVPGDTKRDDRERQDIMNTGCMWTADQMGRNYRSRSFDLVITGKLINMSAQLNENL